MEMTVVWSSVLTAAISLLAWTFKTKADQVNRIQDQLMATREQIAREYVTKAEVHADINRVIDRLEALDAKLDRLMERSA